MEVKDQTSRAKDQVITASHNGFLECVHIMDIKHATVLIKTVQILLYESISHVA